MHSHTSEHGKSESMREEKPKYSQIDANGMSDVTQCDVIQRQSHGKLEILGVEWRAFRPFSSPSTSPVPSALYRLCNIRPICRWAANALSFFHIAQAPFETCPLFSVPPMPHYAIKHLFCILTHERSFFSLISRWGNCERVRWECVHEKLWS